MKNEWGGAIPSPADVRDYTVASCMEASGEALPNEYAVWQPPVENQGQTGNCVAQALSNIMECIRYKDTNHHYNYSVGYIYGNRQNSVYKGSGMIPRDACSNILKDGDCLRIEWESFEEVPEIISHFLEVNGKVKADTIQSYVSLNTFDDLKRFILKYSLPVMIIARTSDYYAGGAGSHATACYGWNADKLLYTNSWGTGGFLGDGRGEMAYEKNNRMLGVCSYGKNKLF